MPTQTLEPDALVRIRLEVLAARLLQLRARERRDRYDEDLAVMRMDWALDRWARITRKSTPAAR